MPPLRAAALTSSRDARFVSASAAAACAPSWVGCTEGFTCAWSTLMPFLFRHLEIQERASSTRESRAASSFLALSNRSTRPVTVFLTAPCMVLPKPMRLDTAPEYQASSTSRTTSDTASAACCSMWFPREDVLPAFPSGSLSTPTEACTPALEGFTRSFRILIPVLAAPLLLAVLLEDCFDRESLLRQPPLTPFRVLPRVSNSLLVLSIDDTISGISR
mmetsp:Transcript_1986/g.5833  ORF Transcript_1986/g.5833 Transcript_1986/m.5833 type:complete len:218 (-) Transcript_1986:839-1492(-)